MEQHQPKIGSLESWLSDASATCSHAGPAPRSTSPFANQPPQADAFTPPRCVSLTARLGQPPLISLHPADLLCTIRNPCDQCVSSTSGSITSCCATATATASSTSSSCAIDVNHEGTMHRGRPRLYRAHVTASSLPLPAAAGGGLSLESLCSALSSPASHIAMAVTGSSREQHQQQPQQQPHPHAFLHSVSEDCRDASSSSGRACQAAAVVAAAAAPSSLSAVHTAGNASANKADKLLSLRRQMEQLLMPLPDGGDQDDCCAATTTTGPGAGSASTAAAAAGSCSTLQRACALADQRTAAAAREQSAKPMLSVTMAAGVIAAAAAVAAAAPASSAPPLTTRRGLFEGTVRGGEPRNQWVLAPAPVAIVTAAC
ncbi:hypothetical protein HXX76_000997 [Chlamydomonas incerta]|uniref:Uncharacterized protein n=1 Tax=Chlamydomonas incerta TaxID=51695 RepID=A0A835WBG4_CHLIN|nr:hypothetical protein HXX76_000997 [Chlamydomonas incerta]|eukprot:KAG2444240.1 hypothetical protein HXX76_000997 [Chlamydomonas incerta]